MIIGNELRNVLQNSKEKIAKKFLNLCNDDEPINGLNYLNIALSDPYKISYISKDRLPRFVYDVCEDLLPIGSMVKLYSNYANSDHSFTVSEYAGRCYYRLHLVGSPREKIPMTFGLYSVNAIRNYSRLRKINTLIERIDRTWDNTYRLKYAYMISPSKILTKLGIECSDKEKEIFGKIFFNGDIGMAAMNLTIELVNGSNIPRYYNESNYYSGGGGCGGSLNGSCMRDSDSQSFVSLYAEYPEQIRMLIMKDIPSGDIRGRAIVWNCFDGDAPITFMDRIYTDNSNFEQFFKNYAMVSGWYFKREQNYNNLGECYIPQDKYEDWITVKLSIVLDNANYKMFPYLDTFAYGNLDCNDVILRNYNSSNYDLDFHSTDGGPFVAEEDDIVWSDYLNEDISREDSVYSDRLGSYLMYSDSVSVRTGTSSYNLDYMPDDHEDICECSHFYYFIDDCDWSEYYGRYINDQEGSIVCLIDGDYVFEGDAVQSTSLGGWILEEEATYSKFHDDYYMKDDVVFSEFHDSYVEKEFYNDYLEELKEEEAFEIE